MRLPTSIAQFAVGRLVAGAVWLAATVVAASGQNIDPLNIPDTQLEPVKWAQIDGWARDDHAAAYKAFQASCEVFNRQRQLKDTRAVATALKDVCRRMGKAALKGDKARAFFEENFRPVRIAKLGENSGLLTGYYEPIVDGSRMPNPQFHFPLYRRPRDLVLQGQKVTSGAFPNRGTVGRLNDNKEFEPYYDRLAIEEGALDGRKLEICYLADPFEVMTIQIQGSARVRLEDGTMLRLNYDGHNGHNYTAVGRILIERNLIPREEMSMDRIRRWMLANPDQAKEVRGTNRSYVFFRITGLNKEDEPVGAQGVHLTPGRSIAVDRTHVYGTPFFIESELPIESPRPATKFRRLMVAQDTGSAILGPARADLYWGAGDNAGKVAGRIRHQGRFVMLMPRSLDMVEAGRKMPLPRAKPPVPTEVAKVDGKPDKTEGKADNSKNAKSDSSKSGNTKSTASSKSDNGKPGDPKNAKARPQAGKSKPGT